MIKHELAAVFKAAYTHAVVETGSVQAWVSQVVVAKRVADVITASYHSWSEELATYQVKALLDLRTRAQNFAEEPEGLNVESNYLLALRRTVVALEYPE